MTLLVRVALVVLACASLTACGASNDESASPSSPPPPSTETSPHSGARDAAPAIAGTTLDGQAIALGDFRGRPVLVNVWSSW